jgi:hypothetical protein
MDGWVGGSVGGWVGGWVFVQVSRRHGMVCVVFFSSRKEGGGHKLRTRTKTERSQVKSLNRRRT